MTDAEIIKTLEEVRIGVKSDLAREAIDNAIAEVKKHQANYRDCANCKHHMPDGCELWDCNFEEV